MDDTSAGGPRPGRPFRPVWFLFKWVFPLVLLAGAGAWLWVWGALRFHYAEGERTGVVRDFSRQGWFVKTWEGDLLPNGGGGSGEVFSFTVRDDEVARRIQQADGRRVVLTFHYHRGLPPRLFGETPYFIVDVRPAAGFGGGPAIPVPADASSPPAEIGGDVPAGGDAAPAN